MKNQNIHKRLLFALHGIHHTWKKEKSFRTQVGFAGLWLIGLAIIGASIIWWAIFVCIIAIILALELCNTALENLADHLHPEQHPSIKIVKDCSAGAILILSFCSVLLALLFLIDFMQH